MLFWLFIHVPVGEALGRLGEAQNGASKAQSSRAVERTGSER